MLVFAHFRDAERYSPRRGMLFCSTFLKAPLSPLLLPLLNKLNGDKSLIVTFSHKNKLKNVAEKLHIQFVHQDIPQTERDVPRHLQAFRDAGTFYTAPKISPKNTPNSPRHLAAFPRQGTRRGMGPFE